MPAPVTGLLVTVNAVGIDNPTLVTVPIGIAAVESLIFGKPVFTMGPNAATPLANKDLVKIEKPYMPSPDEVRVLCMNLAYAQFTTNEMQDGTAWKVLQKVYAQ